MKDKDNDRFYQLCQENGKIHIGCITIQNIENIQSNNNSPATATLCGIIATCESLAATDVLWLSQIDTTKVTCDECNKKHQDLTQYIKSDINNYEERV